jgi:DNA-binding LacI/PurR family transcriptional regulator
VLYRKIEPEGRRCYIKLNDAWMFSEDHNPQFEAHIQQVTEVAYEYLGMGVLATSRKAKAQRMAEIATLIENRIDDLINCPPTEVDTGKMIQDATFRIGEQEIQGGITDRGYVHV